MEKAYEVYYMSDRSNEIYHEVGFTETSVATLFSNKEITVLTVKILFK